MKKWLLNKLASGLYGFVTEDKILRPEGLSEDERLMLKNNSKMLKRLKLWKDINHDMKYVATKMMYDKSESSEHILQGKMILFTLDVMEKKIDKLSKLK